MNSFSAFCIFLGNFQYLLEKLLDDLTEVDVDVVGEPRSEVETGSEANIDCPSVEVFVVDFFLDLVDSATELTFFVGEGIY